MQQDAPTLNFPASAAIDRRRLLAHSATTGKVAPAAGAVGERVVGASTDDVTATGTAGVRPPAAGTVCLEASEAIGLGKPVWPTTSGKIKASGTGRPYGIALEAATGDGHEIEVLPLTLVAATIHQVLADSTAVTNTTTKTPFAGSGSNPAGTVVIPADALWVGAKLRGRIAVACPSTNSTDTLTITVDISDGTNTVVLATTGAVDVANGNRGYIEFEAIIRAIGATGKIECAARGLLGTTPIATGVDESTLITTAALTITVNATWSVANANNQAVLKHFTLDLAP